jgi:hypothetical protein
MLTAAELVEGRGEPEDIETFVGRFVTCLGRHISGCPECHASGGPKRRRGREADGRFPIVGQPGDPEVDQLHDVAAARVRGEHHVLWLDVAMDDAPRVQVCERPRDGHTERHDLTPWKRPLRVEAGAQASARDHLERHIRRPVPGLAARDRVDHVRMLQIRHDVDLLGEPGPKIRVRGAQDLDRHHPAHLTVHRPPDHGGAALTEPVEQDEPFAGDVGCRGHDRANVP